LQTRIKGGDHIYSLSSKTILQINPDDIREWRRQESKRLDSFVKRFDSEGPISLLSLYKNFHVYEISDGSGKSVILFAPPNDNPFDLGVFSKWHISRSGKLSSWVTRPDGTFKILMK
jgi:hypothetical protein